MQEKSHPGNANLPIGRRTAGDKPANQAIGDPREIGRPTPASRETGVPGAVPRGWHSRGYLPHFDGTATQHVTLHLADSLPHEVLERMIREIEALPEEERDVKKRKRVEAWIDAGHGWCILREPEIARMVQGALLYFDAERYRLLAWVIMPNHVHVLFEPTHGWSIADIVASWKKFTARGISDWRNSRECQSPDWPSWSLPVWHREYWDRYMRNEYHFRQTVRYIHQNPVEAGLTAKAEDWLWSSAFPGNANLPIGHRAASDKPANQEIGDPRGKL